MPFLYDPAEAVSALTSADPVLGDLIDRVGPFTLAPRELVDPFGALFRSIVYQQLSGKAAATIFGRVCALFGSPEPPTPRQLLEAPEEALRAAGLSRAKTAAARDLALKTLEGVVPPLDVLERLPDEEVIRTLTRVRGIGPWTVEMLLIFWMGRPDVLPVSDLGVRRGFQRTFGLEALPDAVTLLDRGERWRPFRSVASWYLWRAADTPTP